MGLNVTLNSECACIESEFIGIKFSINVTLSGDCYEFQQTLVLKSQKRWISINDITIEWYIPFRVNNGTVLTMSMWLQSHGACIQDVLL